MEATVKEVADQIAAEEDAAKKAALAVELAARQEKLDALMEQFAVSRRRPCPPVQLCATPWPSSTSSPPTYARRLCAL